MKNKKGFTLVELVIVIAVIAILAGVMIGTFASVVKKAKESAKMQEMTAQKQEQIANDIDQKLKNAEWLGWTDFEEKLADALTETMNSASVKINDETIKEATNDAVEKAFAKYAASLGQGNTGLTADQVKYIVETALSNKSYSGVTAEQVKAIINNATSGLSNLSKAQVQAIVDAAQAKNLTVAQVTAAVTNATKNMNLATTTDLDKAYDKINTAISAAVKDLKDATLTEADIEALLAKYITNGEAKGDYTWYNANATTMAIANADQVVALSTMAKGGTSFAGKTIELPAEVDLTKTDFQPIMDFDGTLKGAVKDDKPATKISVNITPVWNIMDGRNGKTMLNYMAKYNDGNTRKDAVAYGFVASLKEGGVVENINLVLATDFSDKDPGSVYTYFGGLVGFLDGGTIRGCTVKGTIEGYNRIGGVVGWARKGTIENVSVEGLTIKTKAIDSSASKKGTGYLANSAFAAYVSGGEVVFKNCKVEGAFNFTNTFATDYDNRDGAKHCKYGYFVGQFNDTKDGEFKEPTKIVLIGCTINGVNDGKALTSTATTWTDLNGDLKSTESAVKAIGGGTMSATTSFEIKEK